MEKPEGLEGKIDGTDNLEIIKKTKGDPNDKDAPWEPETPLGNLFLAGLYLATAMMGSTIGTVEEMILSSFVPDQKRNWIKEHLDLMGKYINYSVYHLAKAYNPSLRWKPKRKDGESDS